MFDLHVHSAPCVFPRLGTDADVVGWYEEAGFSGCVLKGHYESTVGRARVAGEGRGPTVYGGIVLNAPVGGFNPSAVAAALELGARVVWMPTLDARAHALAGLPRPRFPGAPAATYAAPPVDPSGEGSIRRILELVAEADAVLATGHLGREEIGWLVPAALRAGVRRVLLTHPTYTVPALSVAETVELAGLGAYAEVTAFQLLHQAGCEAPSLGRLVSALGPGRCVLSSDAGQPDSPRPPDALLALVDALACEGIDRGALEAMASEVPQALVAP